MRGRKRSNQKQSRRRERGKEEKERWWQQPLGLYWRESKAGNEARVMAEPDQIVILTLPLLVIKPTASYKAKNYH